MTAGVYEVVVRGELGGALLRWFDDYEVRATGSGATALRGWFADQAALLGFLSELGDLGLELSSVRCLSDPPADGEPAGGVLPAAEHPLDGDAPQGHRAS